MINIYFKFYVFMTNRFESTKVFVCAFVVFKYPACDVTSPYPRSVTEVGGVEGLNTQSLFLLWRITD